MSLAAEHRSDGMEDAAFGEMLQKYPAYMPSKASAYEQARYVTIPASVAQRKKHKQALLERDEVVALVDWKLSHGTFRPRLKQLVQSNPADLVESTTAAAFAKYDETAEGAKTCLAELCVLKGIGPATASLLLSVAYPTSAPFFSDELYRWALWENGKAKGWDRPIKYTPKEYLQLFDKVKQLRESHEWPAVDLEKVAFVLGKRAGGTPISSKGSTTASPLLAGEVEDNSRASEKRNVSRVAQIESPPQKKAKADANEKQQPQPKTDSVRTTAKGKSAASSGTRSSARIRAQAP